MPPKILIDPTKEKWVNVTWMPHTNLSQSSHVCLSVRSAHAILDDLEYDLQEPEWRVRIGVYGLAGLPLVPVQSHTTAAVCMKRTRQPNNSKKEQTGHVASVFLATHDCHFDYFINIPIRWRDLPRDAYLLFEVLGHGDRMVRIPSGAGCMVCGCLYRVRTSHLLFACLKTDISNHDALL